MQTQQIGKGVFRQQFTKQLQNNILSKDQFDVLSSISWLIIEENAQEWDSILSYMEQSKAYIIKITSLNRGKKYSILKSLQRINFVSLKKLTLTHINIQNIQFLQFMNAQRLVELSLKGNQIVSVRPFQKSVFDSIQRINIQGNRFLSIQILSRLKIKDRKLVTLAFTDQDQQCFVEDITFLVKLCKHSCTQIISELALSRYCDLKIKNEEKKDLPQAIRRKIIEQVLKRRYYHIIDSI